MPLDSRFIIASDLQSLFRDKDTGLPMSSGTITFYEDQARTIPKSVFVLSGSPPNYSYTDIGNVVTLSIAGTVQYNNNDTILYYFPYEGTPEESDGTVELYYVVVQNSDEVEQFTREAWPNFTAESGTQAEDIRNYIPNGQFLIHTNIYAPPPKVAGTITQPITYFAQGGWSFERPVGSTATDIVTFPRYGSYVANPSASPRYSTRLNVQSPNAGDAFKDIRIRFPDVNSFSSDTQQYTFSFEAQTNTGSTLNVQLVLIKNFGTGGSTETQTVLTTFNILASTSIFQYSFTFGTNTGKTIGTLDDDYVSLAIRLPTDTVLDMQSTDWGLYLGAVDVTTFPPTPQNQMKYEAIAGWMPVPAHDASSLYLPLVLSPQGLIFSDAEVSNVVAATIDTLAVGYLPYDGQTTYVVSSYSTDGIPYARLWAKWWDATNNVPKFGTGLDYLFSYYDAPTNQLILSNNSPGLVTVTGDGSIPTGFAFSTSHLGLSPSSGYFTRAYLVDSGAFWQESLYNYFSATILPRTSGFTITSIRSGLGTFIEGKPAIWQVETIAAATLAGTYYDFNIGNPSAGVSLFYVWFTVDGSGSDPAPGGTGIKVDLLSTDTAALVAQKIRLALNGWQVSVVFPTAASAITTGSYFTATAVTTSGTQLYAYWYKKDGSGSAPTVVGATLVEVDIVSADTAAQVAFKTQKAMNGYSYMTLDARGLFLRGWDGGANVDPEASIRASIYTGLYGDLIGTTQIDEVIGHFHEIPTNSGVGTEETCDASDNTEPGTVPTGNTGGLETRPVNTSVRWLVKY